VIVPFILGTHNPDKAREIVEIFVTTRGEPLGALDVGGFAYLVDDPVQLPSSAQRTLRAVDPKIVEDGETLEDNARIKAREMSAAFKMLALGDDTGLEVDALDGEPGVHSARYAGEDATYADNVTKLVGALAGVEPARRTARFATVAVAWFADGRVLTARGEVEGVIAATPQGAGGFGYDPVFVPAEGDGRTFAEMAPDEKHAISHRGRAFRALAELLEQEG
jgi:XTP/dITP diphosphohydrolase